VPRISAWLSSHSIFTAWRPCIAAHVFSATTATPREIATTSTTPLIAFAPEASTDFTVAPNRGGCTIIAVSMPGSFTSRVKSCRPVDFARVSRRRSDSSPM
jgi:hypothetical protein